MAASLLSSVTRLSRLTLSPCPRPGRSHESFLPKKVIAVVCFSQLAVAFPHRARDTPFSQCAREPLAFKGAESISFRIQICKDTYLMSSYLSSQFKFGTARFLTHRSLSYVCRSPSTPVILALEDTEDGRILDKVVARLPCPTVGAQQPQNN